MRLTIEMSADARTNNNLGEKELFAEVLRVRLIMFDYLVDHVAQFDLVFFRWEKC